LKIWFGCMLHKGSGRSHLSMVSRILRVDDSRPRSNLRSVPSSMRSRFARASCERPKLRRAAMRPPGASLRRNRITRRKRLLDHGAGRESEAEEAAQFAPRDSRAWRATRCDLYPSCSSSRRTTPSSVSMTARSRRRKPTTRRAPLRSSASRANSAATFAAFGVGEKTWRIEESPRSPTGCEPR